MKEFRTRHVDRRVFQLAKIMFSLVVDTDHTRELDNSSTSGSPLDRAISQSPRSSREERRTLCRDAVKIRILMLTLLTHILRGSTVTRRATCDDPDQRGDRTQTEKRCGGPGNDHQPSASLSHLLLSRMVHDNPAQR